MGDSLSNIKLESLSDVVWDSRELGECCGG